VSQSCEVLIKNQYDDFAQMVIQGEKQQGYIYNEFIVDLIKDYDNNRNNYKTFNDYVPVFLDKLKQKLENK
jgi:adenosine deaminase